jgi:hypothetical protein
MVMVALVIAYDGQRSHTEHIRLKQADLNSLVSTGRLEIMRANLLADRGSWIEINGRCFILTTTSYEPKRNHPQFRHIFESQSQLAKLHVHDSVCDRCSICGYINGETLEQGDGKEAS